MIATKDKEEGRKSGILNRTGRRPLPELYYKAFAETKPCLRELRAGRRRELPDLPLQ